MKKVFLAIITSIILTGCTIEYNLTIEEDNLSEETQFLVSNQEYQNDERIQEMYNYPHSIFITQNIDEESGIYTEENFTYYEKNIITENDLYRITYKATYQRNNYNESRLLNVAFTDNNIELSKNKGNIIARDLILFNNYNSYNIDKLIVNIKISDNYEVVNHNATSISNNVYTWIFYNNSQSDEDIIIEYTQKKSTDNTPTEQDKDPTKVPSDTDTSSNKNSDYIMYIFLGVILILILIGYIAFNKLKERNNKLDD